MLLHLHSEHRRCSCSLPALSPGATAPGLCCAAAIAQHSLQHRALLASLQGRGRTALCPALVCGYQDGHAEAAAGEGKRTTLSPTQRMGLWRVGMG